MPTMADITVKKADGTTNVTYVAATPSAGDKSPAVWTQNAAASIAGYRPKFEMQTQPNGTGTMRQARFKFSFPKTYVDTATGLTKLQKTVDFDGVIYLANDLGTSDWLEAFAQLGNLLASTLVRQSVETGFAPT